jgi:predicted amidohydrolase
MTTDAVQPLDPETNFQAAATHIREAASQGASLAVLPEYHLSGWVPHDPGFAKLAVTAYEYVAKYQELAKEHKINIVPGTIVTSDRSQQNGASRSTEDSGAPPLHNISPFISYTGEILGSYTKANLWHPERPHLTSGPQSQSSLEAPHERPEPHTVIETPLGPVGILICWDLGFPEAFRSLILQGAKIIIIPTFWTAFDMSAEGLAYNKDAEVLFLKSTLVARAFENTACIVFCNAGGPREEGYVGLSGVTMPIMGTLPNSFEDGELGVRVIETDMKLLDIAEANYKVREDLQREDWHYGYSHAATTTT